MEGRRYTNDDEDTDIRPPGNLYTYGYYLAYRNADTTVQFIIAFEVEAFFTLGLYITVFYSVLNSFRIYRIRKKDGGIERPLFLFTVGSACI